MNYLSLSLSVSLFACSSVTSLSLIMRFSQVALFFYGLLLIIIIIIIIIMYIYHALINALSAHMIHINLNMIFYTRVEHSPTKNNLHKVFI